MKSTTFIAKATLALAVCSSVWPLAHATTPVDETPAAPPPVVAGLGEPLASHRLDHYRGGFDLVKNDMKLMGSVANNSAEHVWSGNNVIADGAFANTSGFPMVVQNSGSNVLIQNATIVNVQVK